MKILKVLFALIVVIWVQQSPANENERLSALYNIQMNVPLVVNIDSAGHKTMGYSTQGVDQVIQQINQQGPGTYNELAQIRQCPTFPSADNPYLAGYEMTCVDGYIQQFCGAPQPTAIEQACMGDFFRDSSNNAGYDVGCIFRESTKALKSGARVAQRISEVGYCPVLFSQDAYPRAGFELSCVHRNTMTGQQCAPTIRPYFPPVPPIGSLQWAYRFMRDAQITIQGATVTSIKLPHAGDHPDMVQNTNIMQGDPLPTNRPSRVEVQCRKNCRLVSLDQPTAANGYKATMVIHDTEDGRNTVSATILWYPVR